MQKKKDLAAAPRDKRVTMVMVESDIYPSVEGTTTPNGNKGFRIIPSKEGSLESRGRCLLSIRFSKKITLAGNQTRRRGGIMFVPINSKPKHEYERPHEGNGSKHSKLSALRHSEERGVFVFVHQF